MIRLLLVDDHVSSREALGYLLERESDVTVIAQAGSLAEVRQLRIATEVDIALVDLDLPDGSGVEVIRDLRPANPDALAIVLTASRDHVDHARAVAAGAAAIMHKSARTAEIVDAIRRLATGEPLLAPREMVALLQTAGQWQEDAYSAKLAITRLTARERELLQLLGAGLSDQAIADRLYISPKTVRNHMVNLLDKLGVDSRLQALLVAIRHGIVTIR